MERMLQWESINELNDFRLLDCDPRVTVFTEQPCEIGYFDERGKVLALSTALESAEAWAFGHGYTTACTGNPIARG
jgi:hypothetical protein